jgi:hypothetical protein
MCTHRHQVERQQREEVATGRVGQELVVQRLGAIADRLEQQVEALQALFRIVQLRLRQRLAELPAALGLAAAGVGFEKKACNVVQAASQPFILFIRLDVARM